MFNPFGGNADIFCLFRQAFLYPACAAFFIWGDSRLQFQQKKRSTKRIATNTLSGLLWIALWADERLYPREKFVAAVYIFPRRAFSARDRYSRSSLGAS
ncbi:MAG: hypothetical protein Q4G52_07305, partial [Clostridia bacterium]|nr:hypothetical protein [Clostridia bacterium]